MSENHALLRINREVGKNASPQAWRTTKMKSSQYVAVRKRRETKIRKMDDTTFQFNSCSIKSINETKQTLFFENFNSILVRLKALTVRPSFSKPFSISIQFLFD